MDDAIEVLRNLIVSRQSGRNINPDNLLPILLAGFPDRTPGERTFVEDEFLTPSVMEMMERLTTDEKELCEVDPIVWTKFRQSLDGAAG